MAKFSAISKKIAENKAGEIAEPVELSVEEQKVEEVISNGLQEETKEIEVVSVVKVEDAPQEAPKPLTAKVMPNKTFRVYIGNRFYNFVEGEEETVPVGVVFALREIGNIE